MLVFSKKANAQTRLHFSSGKGKKVLMFFKVKTPLKKNRVHTVKRTNNDTTIHAQFLRLTVCTLLHTVKRTNNDTTIHAQFFIY